MLCYNRCMQHIGDLIRHHKNSRGIFIWAACPDCGKERWVKSFKGKPINLIKCNSCAKKVRRKQWSGSNSARWKGGRQLTSKGYIRVWVSPEDFFFAMADPRGYMPEHRLVMAKHLGRLLHKWELIHHKGIAFPLGSIENKQDNRIENLMIIVTGHKGNAHRAKITCPHCQQQFLVR